MIAGMRPFGLYLVNSGFFMSGNSRYTDSYVSPSSSRTKATFLSGIVRNNEPKRLQY